MPNPNVNQPERAARLWPFLVSCAAQRRTASYGDAAAHIGIHPRPIRFVLEQILNYCLATGKPLLTALVVSESTGQPGAGLQARAPQFSEQTLDEVFDYPWTSEPNPFEWALTGKSESDVQSLILAVPSRAKEAYALVKTRGMMQVQFRKALMTAYGGVCSFSGIAIPQTLEAAHIVPWSSCDPELRGNVTNGILISSLHHKLFESGFITLTNDHRIWCDKKRVARFGSSELVRLLVLELHGRKIREPKRSEWLPAVAAIERHNSSLRLSPQF